MPGDCVRQTLRGVGLERYPFDGRIREELAAFVRAHRVSGAEPARMEALLARIPASPEHVLDLGAGASRVLVASVLDRLENAGRSALLAILAFRDGPQAEEVLQLALGAAEDLVRRGERSRLDVPLPAALAEYGAVLTGRGYAPAYHEYRMTRPAPAAVAPAHGEGWAEGRVEDAEALRDLALRAFATTPGWHGASLDEYRRQLHEATLAPRLLFRDGRLAGYTRVSLEDGRGEIESIARDPALRGRGLGGQLLTEAMRLLVERGARELALEVVASNASALRLYQDHGFVIASAQTTYRLEL